MPAELKDDLDEQEELNIGDDGEGDDGADLDNGADGEPEDRGDDFVDPELDGNDDSTGDTKTADDKGDGGEGDKADADGDGDANIPHSRLGEVARAKSAATAIADGLVDGSIDPSVVRDFGGAAAVAKAIANREMSLEDIKTGTVQPRTTESTEQAADPNAPATWDLHSKYVEWQELIDAGETKEAATLIQQIHKEERVRERAEDQRRLEVQTTAEFAQQLVKDYPAVGNTKSPEHESVMVWANHFQATQRVSRIEALKMAVEKVGLVKDGTDNGNDDGGQQADETQQQRTLRLRKEAAIKKAAAAQNQQPPPMGLGATPQGAKQVDVDKLGEDDFAKLSKEEKAALRGDKL